MATHRPVHEQIRAAREALGWTQADLAARLGIPQPNVSRAESGTRDMSVSLLGRIADALGVTLYVAPGVEQVIEKT